MYYSLYYPGNEVLLKKKNEYIFYGQYKFRVILHTFWNWKKITSIQGPRRYFEFGAAKKFLGLLL